MSPKGKRIYAQLNADYAIESPYVKYSTGEQSFQPVAVPKIVLLSVVKAEGYPLVSGNEAVQMYSKAGCPMPADAAPDCHSKGKVSREIQYSVIATTAVDKTGTIRAGLSSTGGFSIFGGIGNATDVTISGKNGANALNVIGELAMHGKVRIKRIHAEATDAAYFNNELVLKSMEFNGRRLEDREFNWEKPKAQDENLNIRDIYFKGDEMVLDGKNYLESALDLDETLNLTFYMEHIR